MKIKNYLLDLDNPIYIRKGSDNIRVYGIGEIIKGIYRDLKKHGGTQQIESEFKAHQTFSNWILNKSGIAIRDLYTLHLYWKNICNVSDKELQDSWDKCYNSSISFGSMNGKRITLPKRLDYKLAYLLGIIFGDGHLAEPNRSYDKLTTYNSELRITDQHQETFIFLTNLFQDLFNYRSKIYSEKSNVDKLFYRFVIRSKPLHRFLMVVCGVPVGDKRGKLKIPKLIKNAPLELQKWFISGFFDSDGGISLTKNKWPVLSITQYDTPILNEIVEICSKLSINWSGPYNYKYKYNNCAIKIYNKENVQRFLNAIPSLNPIKLKQREFIWEILKRNN